MGPASGFAWPEGAKAAISLTFDGGLLEHWELVAPILAEHEIRATFFVTVPNLLESPEAWRKVVAAGHEIGSHSHLGISTNGNLPAWTLEMIEEDLRLTDKGILEILGRRVESFALSGSETTCAEGDYSPLLRKRFSGLRSPLPGPTEVSEIDLFNVGSNFWRDLVGPIESYLPQHGQWSVPVFDRFFDADFGAAEEDLRVLIGYLKRRDDIWVAPFGEVVSHVAASRPVGENVL
jgi:peptidoglycan-N-acetylglucosamine deacetylase